ncbi:MAG TPA: hypothetical protein VNZ22_16510, partial [Bacillota bacterium]|nr:hypothetical protein [Bacillota bacterium]
SGQTLRGDNGSYIRGNVVAGSGATIAPGGLASIQYMSVSNNLTLQAGSTVAMEVSLDSGATNDTINVTGTATYNGTLQLANIGATPLTAGNSFKLFKSGGFSGNFATIAGSPGTGLNWTFNPTNGIATVVASTASNPTNITFAVSGNQVTLSWPADHLGWTLQAQTNSVGVGLSTNWVDVPDSATVTQKVMPVNSANGAVFYRLRH